MEAWPPAAPQAAAAVAQEEPAVYSTLNHDSAATLGPTMLQGVGTVDGVASVAKVLLQRVQSSVCSAHRRQQGGMQPMGPAVVQQQVIGQAQPVGAHMQQPHFHQVGQFVRPAA